MKFVLLTLEGRVCHTVKKYDYEAEHDHGFASF